MELREGDMVRLSRPYPASSQRPGPPVGSLGRVVSTATDPMYNNLVFFEGWLGGHEGSGRRPEGFPFVPSYWYVPSDYLSSLWGTEIIEI